MAAAPASAYARASATGSASAARAPFAGEDRAGDAGVRRAVPTARGVARGALETDRLGRDLPLVDRAVPQLPRPRRPARRDLVQTLGAVHDERALRAELAQHRDHPLAQGRRRDAEQLPLHAGRVGQRPEDVEDRADPDLTP